MDQQQPSMDVLSERLSSSSKNTSLLIIGGILLIVVVGGISYFLGMKSTQSKTIVIAPTSVPIVAPSNISAPSTSTTTDQNSVWKTYTSNLYGFSVQYPNNWKYEELTGADKTTPYFTLVLSDKNNIGLPDSNVFTINFAKYGYGFYADYMNKDQFLNYQSQPYNLNEQNGTLVTARTKEMNGNIGYGTKAFLIINKGWYIGMVLCNSVNVNCRTNDKIFSSFKFLN